MGSVFLVLVPIRSYELRLRLSENDILLSPVAKVQAPEADTDEVIITAMKKYDAQSMENNKELLAKDISLPPSKDIIMSYNLMKNNQQLLLQLTRDTVKLIKADIVAGGRVRRVSIVSGTEIAIRDSDEDDQGGRNRRGSYDDMEILELVDTKFLERHMEDVLQKFDLLHSSWETSIDGKFSRICFSVDGAKADKIISHLHAIGFGKKYESTLSVCSTMVFTQERKKLELAGESDQEEEEGKWNNFVQSIKARITVAQVVENVKANAVITFDFLVMLIVAGIIAALGLLESSPVNLIASMLVSPLMGPIMAFTFGAMIHDGPLIRTGLVSEVNGLLLCLVIGLFFGVFLEMAPFPGPWSNVDRWPTSEMAGRGKWIALVVGAAVAIPSGAGVALSILAGNAGSLVGVAISASLLPPAVNCGIFYGLTLIACINEARRGINPFTVPCDSYTINNTAYFVNHSKLYCNNPLREYAIMGTISLCLTLVNIILIFFTGLICLKIKEVAPYTTKTAYERFWKHDLKEVRDYNVAHHEGTDSLINDLAGDPLLLGAVEDDFVFNQIKNRVMYKEENVITKVKEKRSKAVMDQQQPGWSSNKAGQPLEAVKSVRGKKNVK